MTLTRKIWNIPFSNGFADTLAQKLLNDYQGRELELADVQVLLPNRRACKTLADAFVKIQGMKPTLLPHLQPIGDIDEDEIVLQGAVSDDIAAMPPAIDDIERLLLFMKIILARPNDFGTEKISLNQACFLAKELGHLIDMSYYHNLDFSRLGDLVSEEYAAHWQETLRFLEIITAYWPQILSERGRVDASWRKSRMLELQAEIWTRTKYNKKLIIAGTTAGFAAMKKLVKAVLDLPNGEVYLSGLDKYSNDDVWEKIGEEHPQFELKELLDYLGVHRDEIKNLNSVENSARENLIFQTMMPAACTDKWRQIADSEIGKDAIVGLHLLECDEIRQEALAIAIKMREVLEESEKTAALITPDRQLARRVAGYLKRWNIEIDDSAGRPLAVTPWGMFMRLLLNVVFPDAARVDVLALLKNPLTGMGKDYAEIRAKARILEQEVWRAGIENAEAESILAELDDCLAELKDLCKMPKVILTDLLKAHVRVAEALAATADKDGQQLLWRGDAGESGARFIAQLLEKSDILGEIDPREYSGLFEAMMSGKMVRAKYGTHPRLSILGPIEARLNRFDVTIIGEVNEGVWPQLSGADPWMSRPMKKDFGFPLPERSIGVLGMDFAQLLCAKEVYLTRSARVQGTPMMKSRWWMRLQAVLEALGLEQQSLHDVCLRKWSCFLEEPDSFESSKPPVPRPPFAARPRRLSVSGIELLLRDPYSVFAKYILGLKPLEDIEPELTMADYGTIIHGILEEFNKKHVYKFPKNAREELLELGRCKFAENNLANEKKVFWWPKFEKIVNHLVELEEQYRQDIKCIHSEVKGCMDIETAGGKFTVTAKADRIDEMLDGKLKIIDYKTGKARSVKEVEAGFAPQLPLEGLIAEAGGFEGIEAAKIDELLYWQLGVKDTIIDKDIENILEKTRNHLIELITLYDLDSTPYECHPNLKKNPEFEVYAHLARVKEWSANDA
ncbi:MAG: PD-(D/E)XK nuclease family protein [Alphaproteobacteria bacterium]|nr:PD-(D/E)XK nuclease family protein [Alphaproteobacteria bacterium]